MSLAPEMVNLGIDHDQEWFEWAHDLFMKSCVPALDNMWKVKDRLNARVYCEFAERYEIEEEAPEDS